MRGGNWKVQKHFFRFPHLDLRRPTRRKNLPYPSSVTLLPPLLPSRPPKICRIRSLRCAQLCGCAWKGTSMSVWNYNCMHACLCKQAEQTQSLGRCVATMIFPQAFRGNQNGAFTGLFFCCWNSQGAQISLSATDDLV